MPDDETPRSSDAPLSEFPADFSSADTLPGFDVLPQFPKVQPRPERQQLTRKILEGRILELQRRRVTANVVLVVIGAAALLALVVFLALR